MVFKSILNPKGYKMKSFVIDMENDEQFKCAVIDLNAWCMRYTPPGFYVACSA